MEDDKWLQLYRLDVTSYNKLNGLRVVVNGENAHGEIQTVYLRPHLQRAEIVVRMDAKHNRVFLPHMLRLEKPLPNHMQFARGLLADSEDGSET